MTLAFIQFFGSLCNPKDLHKPRHDIIQISDDVLHTQGTLSLTSVTHLMSFDTAGREADAFEKTTSSCLSCWCTSSSSVRKGATARTLYCQFIPHHSRRDQQSKTDSLHDNIFEIFVLHIPAARLEVLWHSSVWPSVCCKLLL